MDVQAKFFKALGDETRLKVVRCLLSKQFCACDFSEYIKKDQTTISRHLKILVEADILCSEKKGRNVIYKVKNNEVKKQLKSAGIQSLKECCD